MARGYIHKRGARSWQIVYDVPQGSDGKRRQRFETVQGNKRQGRGPPRRGALGGQQRSAPRPHQAHPRGVPGPLAQTTPPPASGPAPWPGTAASSTPPSGLPWATCG